MRIRCHRVDVHQSGGASAVSTRDDIYTTGLEMFLRLGYGGTTLDAIAESVGVTKPAIYYHFKSKRELIMEMLKSVYRTRASLAWGNLEESASAWEELKQFNSQYMGLLKQDITQFFAWLHLNVIALEDEEYKELLLDFDKQYESTARRILEKGISTGEFQINDVDATTEIIACYMDGLLLKSIQGRKIADGAFESFQELMRNALRYKG